MPPHPAQKLPPATLKKLGEARSAIARHDLQAALKLYKALLAQHPESPVVMGELGHLLGTSGRAAQGLPMLERALGLDPESSDLRCKIGRVHLLNVEPDRALVHLEPVCAAEPRRLEALVMATQCCERLNKLDDALAYAERAVAVRRNDPEANLLLAQVETRLKRLDSARARLEKLCAKRTLPGDLHHRSLTALGFVLDKLGAYDEAYGAFDQAAEEIGRTPLFERVDGGLAHRRLDAYRGKMDAGAIGRFAGVAFDTPAPAFLVGFPRSGTTMTEQVIAAHPRTVTSDEKSFIDKMGRALVEGQADKLDVPRAIAGLDEARVGELRRVYWRAVEELVGHSLSDLDGRLFLDKLPLNIIDLPMINAVFPDARVIVALRDPRDVCLSAFMQWFAPNPAMVHLLRLDSAARFYESVMSLYLEARASLSVPVLQVRYEDTVADLESQARRIIEHLGLDWHDDLLRFHEKAAERAIRTPSYAAVTEKVHTRAVARWRNYEARIRPLMPHLGPFIDEFGYA
jgi:tetratricopeptide (TPR) repeat protein